MAPLGLPIAPRLTFHSVTGLPQAPGVHGNVFRAQPAVDPGGSNFAACILGDCDRATSDKPTQYANGLAATNDLYIRFQMYTAPGWHWPQVLDNKVFFFYPNKYTSPTEANVDSGLAFWTDTYCANKNFSDALSFRVGSNSGPFKGYPADANISPYNSHFEYCDGTGAPNGSMGDTTVPIAPGPVGAPSSCEPNPGTVFRMCTGRWYTVEFRYKLSDPGQQNGTIEAWINGVKVYSDSDLETCGDYGPDEGDCYALHEIRLHGSWYNYLYSDCADAEQSGSYRLIDNLVISKSYIGVPASGVTDTVSPGSPKALVVM